MTFFVIDYKLFGHELEKYKAVQINL